MPTQHDEVVNCQRSEVILDVVLPNVPLHRLLQDRDLILQYLQFSSGNECPWKTLERDTVDMFGNGGDPRACIGNVRVNLPSNRPTDVFLAKLDGENVIVPPVFDPAPGVVVGIPYVSKRREENEGTREARKVDSRGRLPASVLDEVATQRESEITTSGITHEDDVFWDIAEFDEVHISVEGVQDHRRECAFYRWKVPQQPVLEGEDAFNGWAVVDETFRDS